MVNRGLGVQGSAIKNYESRIRNHGFFEQDDGFGGEGFAAADGADGFAGLGFDVDGVGGQAEQAGERLADRLLVWSEFGFLRENNQVQVHGSPAGGGHSTEDGGDDLARVAVL